MKPVKRGELQLEETQTYNKASHPTKTCLVPPVWREGARQRRLYGTQTIEQGTMATLTLVETKRNTDVNTKEKSRQTPRANDWHRGVGEIGKRKICGMEADTAYSPARGRSV